MCATSRRASRVHARLIRTAPSATFESPAASDTIVPKLKFNVKHIANALLHSNRDLGYLLDDFANNATISTLIGDAIGRDAARIHPYAGNKEQEMSIARFSTGVPGLDERLGGGLIPGTTAAIVGASGVGKTQFSLQFLNAGLAAEGSRGVILDLTSRGDSQNHAEYAKSRFNWLPEPQDASKPFSPEEFFDKMSRGERYSGEYLQAFPYTGRRVTRRDLDEDEWRDWKADLTKRLDATIAFLYTNFAQGARRLVVDGIEPVEHQGDSIQFELLEYVDQQVVKTDAAWVARDLFRQNYRAYEQQIAQTLYSSSELATILSYTSRETSLDTLIDKPLEEGDFFAQANTVIYLGKIRDGLKFRRAMYIFKHRGSVCSDEIIFYEIDDSGLHVVE